MHATEQLARRYFDAWTSGDHATVTMVAQAYQDEVGFQLYDASRGERTIRVAEQLTIRDGRIASSNFVTDMAAFAAFAGAGGRP
jgi:hypothetical protein